MHSSPIQIHPGPERGGRRFPILHPPSSILAILCLCFAEAALSNTPSTTAVYVSQYFELRDHGAPTKYVFDGGMRVARAVGPLSGNPQLQRLTVRAGWNLRSLAVTASNALGQFSSGSSPSAIEALYRWSPGASNFVAVTAGETLLAGTVLWIRSLTNVSLSVSGTYVQPAKVVLLPGGNFVASAGVETWILSNALPASASVWKPVPGTPGWTGALGNPPGTGPTGTEVIGPGEAMFVQVPTAVELSPPAASERVVYYHDDQIGSAACVSDSSARVLTETAYYPYGVERNTQAASSSPTYYRFTGKERDAEHGLLNFESRLLWPAAARFIRVDSLADKFKAQSLHAPQALNPYSYCQNNPVIHIDADGREARVIIHDHNQITVQVAIQYVGPLATKRNIAIANKGIEKYWSGKFGRYHVKMEVVDPAKDDSLQPAVVTLTSKDDKNKKLRSFVQIEADTGQWNPKEEGFGWVAAHETGHLIGLDDRYTDKKGADRGWHGNMMGEYWGTVQEKNIKELVSPSEFIVPRTAGEQTRHHRTVVNQTSAAIAKARAEEKAALERDLAIQRNSWDISDK